MNPTKAPTADELLADPVVQTALDQAWLDSEPDEPPHLRHEEGGWIYLDLKRGKVNVVRANRGSQDEIDLSKPVVLPDCVVVGKFHTHPNPAREGWLTGPSSGDLAVDALHGVPDVNKAEDGTYVSGPRSRRGGLGGGPGFPV